MTAAWKQLRLGMSADVYDRTQMDMKKQAREDRTPFGVAELLRDPRRRWTPNPPAKEREVARLRKSVPFVLPPEYIELLRYCDGGNGDLRAAPLLFSMDSIAESIKHNQMWHEHGEFLQFWFIGGNAGLETIGFDLRKGPPWPIVAIDLIAGEDSAMQIARNIRDFIEKIGIEQRK